MLEKEEKEFDPSSSDEFQSTINEILDLPKEYEEDSIDIKTEELQLIEIPDDTSTKEKKADQISDFEIEAYDSAIAASLAELFHETTTENEVDDVTLEPAKEKETNSKQREKSGKIILQESEPKAIVEIIAEPEVLLEKDQDDISDGEIMQEDHTGEEAIIDDINAALALQVNEMSEGKKRPQKTKKWLLCLIPLVGIVFLIGKKREGIPKWLMYLRIAVFTVFVLFLLAIPISGGKVLYNIAGAYIRWRMATEEKSPNDIPIPTQTEENQGDSSASNGNSNQNNGTDKTNPNNPPRTEEGIINILLIGEEKIGGGSRGNTDLLMIATMDVKQKTVKLTSLMRDMLVAVPGQSDNRINAVYMMGGIDLLYDTIEMNFEIALDGYMLVDFDSFEKIIDNLDGVIVELSKTEADYLNTTNYISNPAYRNVVPGLNKLNGNQALGYCRVRKVPTPDNTYADFGRTSRQRVVLNAIFEKMKTKNLFQLALIADACLPLVKTDLTAGQISDYMELAVENRITNFVQMRIPIEGTYDDATYNGLTDLIKINFPENNKALHEFIFGDYKQ